MHNILEASWTYRLLAAIYAWFGRQWRESRILSAFLRPGRGMQISESSLFTRLGRLLHSGVCFLFEKLRLTRLLEGSVFKRAWFWCMLPVAAAPVLPTMLTAALAAVGAVSVFLCFACDRARRQTFAPVNKYILLFAALYLAATFTSVTVEGSLQGGLLTVFFVVFSVIFQNSVQTKRQLDRLTCVLVGVGAVVSLYGIAQYMLGLGGAGTWIDSDKFSEISMRVYATLENPNVLAEYLILVFPLAFALLLTGKGTRGKFAGLCCCGLIGLCMILTFSRGGWLGLLAAMAVFLVVLDRRFIILGIAGLIGLYFLLPESVVGRFTSIGDMSDSSTAYRVAIWMGTIAMLRDYWICGIGPGAAAYNMVYPSYSYNAATAQHSHNLYLQLTCDAGVGGIAVFLLLLFSFFRMVCSAISREQERKSRICQIAALSGVFGFLVQSMTDYSFYNYRVMLMFWVMIAMGALYARRSTLEEA